MTRTQAGVLWCAALAVFVLLNPVAGLEQRDWQEAVLVWGGVTAAVVALAGALPPAALAVWITTLAALHRSPRSLGVVLMVLAVLGVYALARKGSAAQVVRVIVAANVVVMLWQALGLWEPLLRIPFPAARYEIWNPARPLAGLTMGTGDVGCVLAMGLPFLASRRYLWAALAAGVALLSTSALSAIVAGMAGLLVALWPQIKARVSGDWLTGYSAVGAMGCVGLFGRDELIAAWTDDRWQVWVAVAKRWLAMHPLVGFGPGSFAAAGVTTLNHDTMRAGLWQQAHFDALQLGYETGLVGVLLAALVFAWAWRRARCAGNVAACGALVALAVCQFGHFPLHLASAGVVAALIVGEATRDGI